MALQPNERPRPHRLVGVLATIVLGGLLFAWFVPTVAPLPRPEPTPEPDAPSVPAATEPTSAEPRGEVAQVARDGAWWMDQFALSDQEPLAAEAGSPRLATLRGRLAVRQQPWVHPAGVPIRLTRSWLDSVLPVETEGAAARAPRRDEPRTETDADGVFVLQFVPSRDELFFLIDPDGAWQDFQKVPDQPRAGELLDLGIVWLDQRGAVTGIVQDAYGRGLAGVEVRAVDEPLHGLLAGLGELQGSRTAGLELWQPDGSMRGGPVPAWLAHRDRWLPFPSTTTAKDGSFTLQGLRPGRHDLFARGRSHLQLAGVRRDVVVAPGRTTSLPVLWAIVSETRQLRFVDEAQRPWANAQVALLQGPQMFGSRPVRTDRSGFADLIVTGDEPEQVLFAYPEGGPWIELPVQGSTVAVPKPVPLWIRLFDDRGGVVAGAEVRCYQQGRLFRPVDRTLPMTQQPREVEAGVHRGMCACPLVVVAAAPGFAPAVAVASPSQSDLLVRMLPIGTLTVHVVDPEQRPIAGATVRVHVGEHEALQHIGAQWAAVANHRVRLGTTDERGELVIPAWPTTFSLQASHPDHAPSAGPPFVAHPGSHTHVILRGGATITGRLTLQQRPAQKGMRVVARPSAPEGHPLHGSAWLDEHRTVVAEDGTFAFRGVAAGEWTLRPELPPVPDPTGTQRVRAEFRSVELVVYDGRDLHVDLEACGQPGTAPKLSGVVQSDGLNVHGAVVRLRQFRPNVADERGRPSRERTIRAGLAEPRLWTHRCDTDVAGSFWFQDLPPGAIELLVEVPSAEGLVPLHHQVLGGDGKPLPPRVRIAVQSARLLLVATTDHRPARNQMLRLFAFDEHGPTGCERRVLLDAHGSADLFDLPAGSWRVLPDGEFGRCEPDQFVVRSGTTTSIDVRLLDR